MVVLSWLQNSKKCWQDSFWFQLFHQLGGAKKYVKKVKPVSSLPCFFFLSHPVVLPSNMLWVCWEPLNKMRDLLSQIFAIASLIFSLPKFFYQTVINSGMRPLTGWGTPFVEWNELRYQVSFGNTFWLNLISSHTYDGYIICSHI